MNYDQMLERVRKGDGFIAALDQSGGSTPKALKGYGIEEDAYATDEEMFGLIHAMRSRIISSPCFTDHSTSICRVSTTSMRGTANPHDVCTDSTCSTMICRCPGSSSKCPTKSAQAGSTGRTASPRP